MTHYTSSDDLTGITYNGTGMTLIDKQKTNSDRWNYLYYLLNPDSGTHNVVITSSGNYIQAAAVSYTGVRQSSQPDAHTTNSETGSTSLTTALTTVADNSWIVSYTRSGGTAAAGSGLLQRLSDGNQGFFDSNGPLSPAGSHSTTMTVSGGGPNYLDVMVVSIAPAISVAFDAATNGGNSSTGTLTFSHTATGTNRILFVGALTTSSDDLTGITYNGTGMTLIDKQKTNSDRWNYLYYLLNPDSGTHNVVITSSGNYIQAAAVSYTGVRQSSQPDAHTTNSETGSTSLTTALTTVADNSWIVSYTRSGGTAAAGSGLLQRLSDGNQGFFDSNGPLSPAGSHSTTMTVSGGGPNYLDVMVVSVAPAVSGVTSSSTVAFDAATNGGNSSTGTLTFSHTATGTNRILFVGALTTSSDDLTGITYNGTGMTLIDKQKTNSDRWNYLYYLLNPDSGTHNVTVTSSGNYIQAAAVSYTGVRQSSQPDAHTTNSETGSTSLTTALTTVADNSWIVSYTRSGGTAAAGTGLTERLSDGNQGFFDSNGPLSPAGSHSTTMTVSGGGPNYLDVMVVSVAPTS
jgi:DNA-binding protein